MRLGAEKIATGHYARVREQDGRFQLLKGLDDSKDQSYFLHRLNQAQLSKTLFPVGELRKTEVRRIAEEIGLPNAKKKDSTGICFIGERPFRDFLNRYIRKEPGPIKDERGRVIGQHQGLSLLHAGPAPGPGHRRRQGKGRAARRRRARALVRGAQGHGAATRCGWCRATTIRGCCPHALEADDVSWIAGDGAGAGQLRRQDALPAGRCALRAVSRANGGFHLDFAEPQWAVTPGQSAVLYDGEVCLGGGVIGTALSCPVKQLLYNIDATLIIGVLFVLMFAAIEAGYRFGVRRKDSATDVTRDHLSAIQASILGLMGLLLAFTFSLSVQRFDTRSDAAVDEANAIGTAYLRTQLLPPALRSGCPDAAARLCGLARPGQ